MFRIDACFHNTPRRVDHTGWAIFHNQLLERLQALVVPCLHADAQLHVIRNGPDGRVAEDDEELQRLVDRLRIGEHALGNVLDHEIARRFLDRLLIGGNARSLFQIPEQAARVALVEKVHLRTARFHLRVDVEDREQRARSRFAHADYQRSREPFSGFALFTRHCCLGSEAFRRSRTQTRSCLGRCRRLQWSPQSEVIGGKRDVVLRVRILRGRLRRGIRRRSRGCRWPQCPWMSGGSSVREPWTSGTIIVSVAFRRPFDVSNPRRATGPEENRHDRVQQSERTKSNGEFLRVHRCANKMFFLPGLILVALAPVTTASGKPRKGAKRRNNSSCVCGVVAHGGKPFALDGLCAQVGKAKRWDGAAFLMRIIDGWNRRTPRFLPIHPALAVVNFFLLAC